MYFNIGYSFSEKSGQSLQSKRLPVPKKETLKEETTENLQVRKDTGNKTWKGFIKSWKAILKHENYAKTGKAIIKHEKL